jgi:PBSX family phage terminase large subunit
MSDYLSKKFHRKQIELLKECDSNVKVLISSGAKRAGKTYVKLFLFLNHVAKFKGQTFVIGGATGSTIERNVLKDLREITGLQLKLNNRNAFKLFGNTVYCLAGANSDSWKTARGFTSAGAFLNEGTALHESFIHEIFTRCSFEGSRIFIDTNPENPQHYLKLNYIDKADDETIKVFNFKLDDNTFLDQEYVKFIKYSYVL